MNSNNTSNNKVNDGDDDVIVNNFVFFDVLKNGTIKHKYPHLVGNQIPPADDPVTGVKIKDVRISPDVSVRLFLPEATCTTNTNKLPLLLYIHGGGFCMESAMSATYTRYVSHLVSQAKVLGISVEYGLFPAQPIPACYDDSWAALVWVASHAKGCGPEPWVNEHADLQRVFVGGDSAGGNISHTMLSRVGSVGLPEGDKVEGMILAHPYFRIGREEDDGMWMYMCPTNGGANDRRMKPAREDLAVLGCSRVLVLVADEDYLMDAGKGYVEELSKSGWLGMVEVVENKGRKHCFHIANLDDPVAISNTEKIVSFINRL